MWRFGMLGAMVSPDLPSFAVIGPGRAGSALARRWRESGAECVGFLGRTVQSASAAVAFVGGGRVLDRAEIDAGFLGATGALLLAVQDDALAPVVEDLAPVLRAEPADCLVLHCSGAHDLAVLAPLHDAGARVGSLHPLCPIPDAPVGYANLPGQPAVIEVHPDDDASRRTLEALAGAAGLVPIVTTGGDRLVYHAACVLAANGLTALYSLVQELFARGIGAAAGGDQDEAAASDALPGALMGAALESCAQHGPVAALSGPVLRGDADLVRRHLTALAALEPGGAAAAELFRLLMRRAAAMAADRQVLSGAARDEMERALEHHG